MIKKAVCFIMALCILISLCGCDVLVTDTAELLSPPLPIKDLYPISKEVAATAGGAYTLQYPSRGAYRSAILQKDIDDDGVQEAFAFYSMADGEVITMHINMIDYVKGRWTSVAKQKIIAGGVNKIDFCDLDNDGKLEILVGWEVYGTSEMQLAVYSYNSNSLTQRFLQKYTHFITCDLDLDEKNELFVISTNAAEEMNTALAYVFDKDGADLRYSCELDSTVKSINEPIVTELSSGRPAVYIDEIKGVGAITEVIFVDKNIFVNPFFDPVLRETSTTLRPSTFTVTDINLDGVLEIPIQKNVPSVARTTVNETLYLTNWCSFNGETLTNQQTTMINVNDGYSYLVSPKWADSIAVLKDTDKRIREIYEYDNETMTVGESLIYFGAVSLSDWDAQKYKKAGYKKILSTSKDVFFCKISKKAEQQGITFESVKNNFKLFE